MPPPSKRISAIRHARYNTRAWGGPPSHNKGSYGKPLSSAVAPFGRRPPHRKKGKLKVKNEQPRSENNGASMNFSKVGLKNKNFNQINTTFDFYNQSAYSDRRKKTVFSFIATQSALLRDLKPIQAVMSGCEVSVVQLTNTDTLCLRFINCQAAYAKVFHLPKKLKNTGAFPLVFFFKCASY